MMPNSLIISRVLFFIFIRAYLHCLLVPCYFLFIALNLMVQLYYSSFVSFNFFRDVFVSFGFGDHILLDAFFIINVNFSDLFKLLLFDGYLIGYGLIVPLLISNFVNIQSLAFLFEFSQMSLKALYLLLILLLLDQLYLQIFFMLFQLLLNDSSISHETSSSHVVLIFKIEYFLFKLIDVCLYFTFLFDDFMQFSTLFKSLQFLQLFRIVVNDLFIIGDFSMVYFLLRCLGFIATIFFSFFLFLLEIDIYDFLKLLQDFQEFLVFSQKLLFIHILVVLCIFNILHHNQLFSQACLRILRSLGVGG